jgi:hypothetical protein
MFFRNVVILFPTSVLKSRVDSKEDTNISDEHTVYIFGMETVCVICIYQEVYTGFDP